MAKAKMTLSWDLYQNNICSGLGSLQQNGEFVDMTLAADGHHVKVHQFMISLISPYLKDIIKSISCSHPVIFLNQISHKTLCSILEYAYTGEVVVAQEDISSLIEAGKALKIKGLEDVKVRQSITKSPSPPSVPVNDDIATIADSDDGVKIIDMPDVSSNLDSMKINDSSTHTQLELNKDKTKVKKRPNTNDDKSKLQYTVSNQGSLQLILNRFIYYMRYNRQKYCSGGRLWRCVDYIKTRCPASVVTKDNIVVQRDSAHTHPFHDKKIMKKIRSGAVFSAIPDAEREGDVIKRSKLEVKAESKEMKRNSTRKPPLE